MTTVNRNAIVPYSVEQMYVLVDNISDYPQFLPWCIEAVEHSRTPDEVHATLTLQWKGLQKSFTTRNLLQPHKMIELRLLEGPFKHLEGFWQFTPLGDQGSKIQLILEFEFSNRLVALAFGKVFEQISQELVTAFCVRAKTLYG